MSWVLRLVLVGVLIMARGAPDDSNVKVGTDLYRLDDLAELAVRLGSIVRYNRAGNVLMVDGFESGLNGWDLNLSGVGSAITLDTHVAYQGEMCVRVQSGTGANPYAGVHKYLPPITPCRVGAQVCFSFTPETVQLLFEMTYAIGLVRYGFGVIYDHDALELQYWSAPGVRTAFASDVYLYPAANVWHECKMIIDLETGEHVRCYLDNTAYDMTGLAPTPGAGVRASYLRPLFRVFGDGLLDTSAYFDNIIVTYNEF